MGAYEFSTVASTSADGSVSGTEAITVARGGPERVELLGTYPNPARSRATVRFAIPTDVKEAPRMHLYDVMGRTVRTVVSGKSEGRHEQTLDVSGLSSGVYFLRLQVGGTVRTQKLTVVQ